MHRQTILIPPQHDNRIPTGEIMKRFTLIAAVFTLASTLALAADDDKVEPGFNEQTFKGLEMRSIGPAFMSGRISDIAIDPNDQSIWYVGVGSGRGCLLDRLRHHRPQQLEHDLGRYGREYQRPPRRLRCRRLPQS
jgi:hypothetical protein